MEKVQHRKFLQISRSAIQLFHLVNTGYLKLLKSTLQMVSDRSKQRVHNQGPERKLNRPFLNYLWPLCQSESWCSPFVWKLVFIHMQMKGNVHMKGWAPGLALKKRRKVIRKWPIGVALEYFQVSCSQRDDIF